MDDISIDIESIKIDGQLTQAENWVAAAVRAHAGGKLDNDVVSQVSLAVADAIRERS